MKLLFKRAVAINWKTTLAGLTISCAGFVSFSPDLFGGDKSLLVQVCHYISVGGFAALGLCAKDFNVVGKGKGNIN